MLRALFVCQLKTHLMECNFICPCTVSDKVCSIQLFDGSWITATHRNLFLIPFLHRTILIPVSPLVCGIRVLQNWPKIKKVYIFFPFYGVRLDTKIKLSSIWLFWMVPRANRQKSHYQTKFFWGCFYVGGGRRKSEFNLLCERHQRTMGCGH